MAVYGLVAVVPSTGLASTVVRDTAQARLWGEITASHRDDRQVW